MLCLSIGPGRSSCSLLVASSCWEVPPGAMVQLIPLVRCPPVETSPCPRFPPMRCAMASPVINTRPPRSIAGPVVLILVGVLFLLLTLGVLDRFSFVAIYGRYWPALLILWGVIKLIEHERSKQAGLPSRGIGAGGVFLALFI